MLTEEDIKNLSYRVVCEAEEWNWLYGARFNGRLYE